MSFASLQPEQHQVEDWKQVTNNYAVSVLSILKNPMILLGLVSCGIFMGMPYLVDNSASSP